MTYPPQQPGPGGWGQQAGNPNVPPGPPQQQPAWYGNQPAQQQAGFPPPNQPQQQPAAGMQPQFPAAAAPNWGGEFGEENWTVQEPGGFGDVDVQDKQRSGGGPMAIVITLVVLLLAGGGAGAWFFLSGAGGPGDATPAAQAVVEKVNKGQLQTLSSEFCTSRKAELQSKLSALKGAKFNVKLGNVSTNGNSASAALSGTYTSADGAKLPVNQKLGFQAENNQWKLCDIGN